MMFINVFSAALFAIAALLLLPTLVLFGEVVATFLSARRPLRLRPDRPRPRVAVVVPANNEAISIVRTLSSIRSQLVCGDRLLVVADNCTDDTARVASESGAEVTERFNMQRRGKGYALDAGIRYLEADPPEVVVVIDADCELHPGSLDSVAHVCVERGRPIQALNLMHAPAGAGIKTKIAEFAWLVKNYVRPLGCMRLGLPCQMMGTGMAFPWLLVQKARLASSHTVEDILLGLDLAAIGAPPLFCPQARVTSFFPTDQKSVLDQHARWEQGHIGVIGKEAPRALWVAIRERRGALAAMVFDLSVPPLSLLVVLLVAQALVNAAFYAAGVAGPSFWVALTALSLLTVSIALSWGRYGTHVISLRELLKIPHYIFSKSTVYARMFKGAKREWVRPLRDAPELELGEQVMPQA